jgi:glycosyltransferase involved in cell wall biosynthesis
MKVLQLCHKPPKPSIDGGCIAMNNISEGLMKNKCKLKIITIGTQKHPIKFDELHENYLDRTKIEGVFVDTKLNLVDAFSNLVTSDSYNISRFFSPDFDSLLIKTLKEQQFDIIHLESLFMTPYIDTIRRCCDSKIVLRSHNLEYMIWEKLARKTINPAKKIYLNILSKQLKDYEINMLNKIDGIAAISLADQIKYEKLGCEKPMITIPFGIDIKKYEYKIESNTRKQLNFFHLGSMDWKPNLEAVSWLLNEIWPVLHSDFKNINLHLAGRKMPSWILEDKIEGVTNHGEVESANQFMNSNDIMLVPLLSAGGMRVKIIEGMALGKTVISTKIGAEGINYKDGENILIANTIEEYKQVIKMLLEHPQMINSIGNKARELVSNYYDNKIITKNLIKFYKDVS